MNKLLNIIPVIFILLGVICLTVTSSIFHSQNSIHTYIESFIGICVYMVVPIVILGLLFFVRRKKK